MAENKAKYIEAVRQLIPINDLPPTVQSEVLNKSSLLNVRKKGKIFKQGDRDAFSFYVLEGQVELQANNQLHNTIVSGTEKAHYAMGQLQPRQFTAQAKTDSVVLRIERDMLDKLMVLHEKEDEQSDATVYDLAVDKVEINEGDEEEDVDWMTRIFQSAIFATIPTANIHQLFTLLEAMPYKAGDTVIKQGEPGDYYYIIQEGECEVLRQPPSGGKDLRLATLSVGDSFGEEALIADTTRNATIKMTRDGTVGKLSKEHFIDLIKRPTLTAVSLETAKETVASGGKWLDVRFKKEHERPGGIDGSINVPVDMLRIQAAKLDASIPYVLFCDTGGRSSTGAFLLTAQSFNVSYLEGGLVNHPELAPPDEVTQVPRTPEPQAAPTPKPTPAEPPTKQGAEAQTAEQKAKQDARIAAAKKQAEQVAQQLREQEQAKLKALKLKAEQRLQAGQKKLESIYSRNAEEVAKLEIMKKEMAEKLQLEKARLEKQTRKVKDDMANAEKLKAELAAARKTMEAEMAKRQQEQEALEKQIQLKAREKLDKELKKLAAEFATQNT